MTKTLTISSSYNPVPEHYSYRRTQSESMRHATWEDRVKPLKSFTDYLKASVMVGAGLLFIAVAWVITHV